MDDVARAAVRASSAASAKPADGDPIPHAPAGHSHAKFFNHAGDLVAWSNREGDIPSGRGGGADVGTAHPACLYVDPYPPSRWFSNGDSFIKQRFTGSVDSHNKGLRSVA